MENSDELAELSDRELKKRFKPKFSKNYEEYYPVKALRELGFQRYVCKNCGVGFWSRKERELCEDPDTGCSENYKFVNRSFSDQELSYREAWQAFASYFEGLGYTEIKRYPVVCRWYDDLEFTTASINDFQPHVVKGEVDPPANPLVVPQFCLRFKDTENVGITGQHYVGFIMPGQHVFQRTKDELFFKNKALKQIYGFLTEKLGVDPSEIVFHEDMWAGGGNFGPSMEYFCKGLELGNQVYMQFEVTEDGYEELETRVIDHGGGLERYAFFSQATLNAYEAVFPYVLEKMKERINYKPDREFLRKFYSNSSGLDVQEKTKTEMEEEWKKVSEKIGYSVKEIKEKIKPTAALYRIADYTRALLFAINDGALPSNVGGGYNLRKILRKSFHLIEKYNFDFTVKDVLKWHIEDLGDWFKELKDYGSLFDIIRVERERYRGTRKKGKRIIRKKLKEEGKLEEKEILKFYDSYGISPSLMREIAREEGVELEIPKNLYEKVSKLHKGKKVQKEERKLDVEGIPKTRKLYYEDEEKTEFKAKVIKRIGDWVVLDQTAFYPGGGGQAYDTGTLNGKRVKEVDSIKGVILHKVKGLEEGEEVRGEINKKRRKKLMRHHTATHIVNYSARKVLGDHIWQHGAKKTPEKARLDITHYKSLTEEEKRKIERLANKVVREGYKVSKKIYPRNEAERKFGFRIYQGGAVPQKKLRIVSINDLDHEACGGTHLSNTKEAKFIKLTGTKRVQDGVIRLEFKAGKQALKEVQKKEKVLNELKELWDVELEKLPETAERFFEEWKKRGKEIEKLKEKLAEAKIKSKLSEKGLVKVKLPELEEFGRLAALANKYKDKFEDGFILIGSNFAYGVSKGKTNIKSKIKEICKKVRGNEEEAKGFKLKAEFKNR